MKKYESEEMIGENPIQEASKVNRSVIGDR